MFAKSCQDHVKEDLNLQQFLHLRRPKRMPCSALEVRTRLHTAIPLGKQFTTLQLVENARILLKTETECV